MSRKLPATASVAEAQGGGKLHAPAAARNANALSDLLVRHAPSRGKALEVASGTGQHVVAFATALPALSWQPTDIEAQRLISIDAHVKDAGVSNVAPAKMLDATRSGWHETHEGMDLIVLVNLLHLISKAEARTVIREAGLALRPGGVFVLYGPFSRDGALTSDGDQRFDAELRNADPQIGYKDTTEIMAWLTDAGLSCDKPQDMPANNLAFLATKGRS